MTETMRSVLIRGAQRYLDGELSYDEFARGVFMAIAEAPATDETKEDLQWLAVKLTSGN